MVFSIITPLQPFTDSPQNQQDSGGHSHFGSSVENNIPTDVGSSSQPSIQGAIEPSINSEIESTLDDGTSDDSNNLNVSNLTAPTLHHPHYELTQEYIERDGLHSNTQIFRSTDVNMSSTVNHYHHIVKDKPEYMDNSNDSGSPLSCSDDNDSSCID